MDVWHGMYEIRVICTSYVCMDVWIRYDICVLETTHSPHSFNILLYITNIPDSMSDLDLILKQNLDDDGHGDVDEDDEIEDIEKKLNITNSTDKKDGVLRAGTSRRGRRHESFFFSHNTYAHTPLHCRG